MAPELILKCSLYIFLFFVCLPFFTCRVLSKSGSESPFVEVRTELWNRSMLAWQGSGSRIYFDRIQIVEKGIRIECPYSWLCQIRCPLTTLPLNSTWACRYIYIPNFGKRGLIPFSILLTYHLVFKGTNLDKKHLPIKLKFKIYSPGALVSWVCFWIFKKLMAFVIVIQRKYVIGKICVELVLRSRIR